MVYKTGTLKGQLTTAEIRKLISAHNKLTNIKIPKGSNRDDIIKLLKSNGWSVNHEKQSLIPLDRPRKKQITLTQAKEVTKAKPLTEEQKKNRQQSKQKREGQKAFLKAAIPKAPSVSKPNKGVKVGKPPPKPAPTPKPAPAPKPAPTKKPVKKTTEELNKIYKLMDEEIKSKSKSILERWIKEEEQYRDTLKDKDGNPIKKVKGGKKPKYIVLQEKAKKEYRKIWVEAYRKYNIAQGRTGLMKSMQDFRQYLNELREDKNKGEAPKSAPKSAPSKGGAITYIKPFEEKKAPTKAEVKAGVNRGERRREDVKFKADTGKTIYETLNVGQNPTPAEVKLSCRKLKLKNHPDKGGTKKDFQNIQRACDIFIDTFLKEGDEDIVEKVVPPNTAKNIMAFMDKYRQAEIKKIKTSDEALKFGDDYVDDYNSITDEIGKIPLPQRDWWDENIKGINYGMSLFIKDSKLTQKRITARYRALRKQGK